MKYYFKKVFKRIKRDKKVIQKFDFENDYLLANLQKLQRI